MLLKKKIFKEKQLKIINKIILLLIFLSIIVVIFLNFKVVNEIKKDTTSFPLPEKEKNFVDYIQKLDSTENRNSLEKILFKELEYAKKTNNLSLGKLQYFIGLNKLLGGNSLESESYFEKALSFLIDSSEDFYTLNSLNDLMNINFHKGNTSVGLQYGIKLYTELKKPIINGVSEKRQNFLSINVLSSLLVNSSNYNLKNTSDKFFIELTNLLNSNPTLENYLSIYAKYQYYFNNGNYEEAKKFANDYIDIYRDDSDNFEAAHFYLLETSVFNKDFEEAKELFKIVGNAYKKKNSSIYYSHLYRVVGMYYYLLADYDDALKYFNKSLELFDETNNFENCLLISNYLIDTSKKANLNPTKYFDKQKIYLDKFDYISQVESLNDSFIQIAYKKIENENILLKEESEFKEFLKLSSDKMNLLYLLVIILLIFLTKILDNEVKKRKEKEIQLQNIISTDYLTKAYSRKFILEKAESLIEKNKNFALLIFDLDKFKEINDSFGHNFGDFVLIEVVSTIKKSIDGIGFLGRLGGEEFIVLLTEDIPLEFIINKIKNDLSKIQWEKNNINVTISGGVTKWNHEDTLSVLLKKSDILLYKAKTTGRNKILIK